MPRPRAPARERGRCSTSSGARGSGMPDPYTMPPVSLAPRSQGGKMARSTGKALCCVGLLLVLAACGSPRPTSGTAGPAAQSQASVPKRLVAATKNVPSFLYYKPHPGPTAGAEELGDLLDAGLVIA